MLLLFTLLSLVFASSHVHTTISDDIDEHGFTYTYRVTNPEVGKEMYWIVVPESVNSMVLEDIQSGNHRAGDSCFGKEDQRDEGKHIVNVRCELIAGQNYRFFMAMDDDRSAHEGGMLLSVPGKQPKQGGNENQKIQKPDGNKIQKQDGNKIQKSIYGGLPQAAARLTRRPSTSISTTQFQMTLSEAALTLRPGGFISTTVSALGVKMTRKPSLKPTPKPTRQPTLKPTSESPTIKPTFIPTFKPSLKPSLKPSEFPTPLPTMVPSLKPSFKPTMKPSLKPSLKPTLKPSFLPTDNPSLKPSLKPSLIPTESPTMQPLEPSLVPTAKPITTASPSIAPSGLEVGDKVEVQEKGDSHPKAGCVLAVPGGKYGNQWIVAVEDDKDGTYLFKVQQPPKMIQSAGCLLDAMDLSKTTTAEPSKLPTPQPSTTTAKPSRALTIEPIKVDPVPMLKEDNELKKMQDAFKLRQKKMQDADKLRRQKDAEAEKLRKQKEDDAAKLRKKLARQVDAMKGELAKQRDQKKSQDNKSLEIKGKNKSKERKLTPQEAEKKGVIVTDHPPGSKGKKGQYGGANSLEDILELNPPHPNKEEEQVAEKDNKSSGNLGEKVVASSWTEQIPLITQICGIILTLSGCFMIANYKNGDRAEFNVHLMDLESEY